MNAYTTADITSAARRQEQSMFLKSRQVADPRLISAKLKASSKFDDLLPHVTDLNKAKLRADLVAVLNKSGEVLPASDSILGKLWKLVNSDRSSLDDCEEVVLLDPMLAARIFRVSNSVAYRGNASTVSEALRCIGFKVLRELAFNAGVFSQFSQLGHSEEWEIFWLRNIFVARVCERISGAFHPTNGTEYLAGLIHDIGWLFIAAHATDEFRQICESEKSIVESEAEILPFTHAQIGAAIAARAGLPLQVIDAVAYHHKKILMSRSTAVEPKNNPLFMGIILGVCDTMADAAGLDLFDRSVSTIDDVLNTEEVKWLKGYKSNLDFAAMVVEERERTEDVYRSFFLEV
jgi:HD-like signal output (HDOD) protein